MRNLTLLYMVLFFVCTLNETIQAQVVISKPNFDFDTACASDSFNNFEVSFAFTNNSTLGAANQFIAELSDGNGSFSSPIAIYTSNAGTVNTSPVTFNFSLPTSAAGEGYLIRVRSTDPNSISESSKAFAAYYKAQDASFTINNFIETGVYCSGGSYLLTIDNPGTGGNNSPLNYPALTFKWYRVLDILTSDFEFVADGNSLSVSEPGIYFAETNYGSCTSDSTSNRVTISESDSNSTTSISSSLGNPYCSTEGATILSAINGSAYQWFKDGEAISGATSQMYKTDISGEYSVNIELESCKTSATINLQTTDFTSSIDVDAVNELEEDSSLFATVTTSAMRPEYEWYLNDALITGANEDSFEITEVGSYKAIVTQTVGCNASMEFPFVVQSSFPEVENIPNLISPNNDGVNDTWVIPKKYVTGSNAVVVIVDSQGQVVHRTNTYQNNWPENQLDFTAINPVYYYLIKTPEGKIMRGSITVIR